MEKVLDSLCPYKVYRDECGLFFYNKEDIKYVVSFTDNSRSFFDDTLHSKIFDFGFEPEQKTKFDKRVRDTLITILIDFFSKDEERVITFTTDGSDRKQLARKRLFNFWSQKYGSNFLKYDIELKTEDDNYYSSLILHENNKSKEVYYNSFFNIEKDLSK